MSKTSKIRAELGLEAARPALLALQQLAQSLGPRLGASRLVS